MEVGRLPRFELLFSCYLVGSKRLIFGFDDFYSGGTEGRKQIVKNLGRLRDLRRQQVAHFVIEQVSLFLTHVDELLHFIVLFFESHSPPRYNGLNL